MNIFKVRATRNKHKFERLCDAALVLTIAVATMAGIQCVPRWLVAGVSGVAALCAAFVTASRPQDAWLQSRNTQQRLQAEQFLFEQVAGDYATNDEAARVRLFADRIVMVCAAGHTQWEQGRKDAANQPFVTKT